MGWQDTLLCHRAKCHQETTACGNCTEQAETSYKAGIKTALKWQHTGIHNIGDLEKQIKKWGLTSAECGL
jgi:hypothetical protein